MSAAYEDVLKRLKEERLRLALSQRDMGRYAHMSQSNYSKAEQGSRRLNYHELKWICDSGADIYYIFTGKRTSGRYTKDLEPYTYAELLCILNITTSLAEFKHLKTAEVVQRRLLERTQLSRLSEQSQRLGRNIFYHVRHFLGHSQHKMAEMLGVDVKKLRELENGRLMPDSEILCRMYELFAVSPAVALRDKEGLVSEIGCLLDISGETGDVFRLMQSL